MRSVSKWILVASALAASALSFGEQKRIEDVVYGHKLGMALTMDVFEPEAPNGIGVLFMVSGGWVSDHASISPEVAKIFTSRGMTVFMVCHGSAPRFNVSEAVKDVTRAVQFVRLNASKYKVNPQRLGVSGGSAGGHLSLMLGSHVQPAQADASDPVLRVSSEVQAVACFFPPTDFLDYGKDHKPAFEIPALAPFFPTMGVKQGMSKEALTELSKNLSPYTWVTASMPPTLIIHGDADTLVPIQQSEHLIEKLTRLKVPNQLIVSKGNGHGWATMWKDASAIADWFEKYLAKK